MVGVSNSRKKCLFPLSIALRNTTSFESTLSQTNGSWEIEATMIACLFMYGPSTSLKVENGHRAACFLICGSYPCTTISWNLWKSVRMRGHKQLNSSQPNSRCQSQTVQFEHKRWHRWSKRSSHIWYYLQCCLVLSSSFQTSNSLDHTALFKKNRQQMTNYHGAALKTEYLHGNTMTIGWRW